MERTTQPKPRRKRQNWIVVAIEQLVETGSGGGGFEQLTTSLGGTLGSAAGKGRVRELWWVLAGVSLSPSHSAAVFLKRMAGSKRSRSRHDRQAEA